MADKYAGTTRFNYAFNSPAVLNDPTGAEPGQLIRTDDTPWEAPAYTRGKYQYYDNFAGWAAGNQWWSGGIDRSWSSGGGSFGRMGLLDSDFGAMSATTAYRELMLSASGGTWNSTTATTREFKNSTPEGSGLVWNQYATSTTREGWVAAGGNSKKYDESGNYKYYLGAW